MQNDGDFVVVLLPYLTLECAPRFSVGVVNRLRVVFTENWVWTPGRFKVNSHIPYRAHAVPLPCRAALIHTCYAAPLPCPYSAVSFVKVRLVAGNIRTASPTV